MNTLLSVAVRVIRGVWAAGVFSSLPLVAAVATSEPVGFSAVSLLPASDTSVALSFLRPAVFTGKILSVTGNVIALDGNPAWSAGQFVYTSGAQPNTYFALIASGGLEGSTFPITSNSTGTLTVDLASGSLAGIAAGDAIRIVPYWTLGTLFPAAGAGVSFAPTTDAAAPQTVVTLYAPPGGGINPSGNAFFYFSGAWRQSGQSLSVNRDDQIIPLHAPLRITNPPSGGSLTTSGAVVLQKLALTLATQVGGQRDNPVALTRPVPVTLDGSGLAASGAFAASSSALVRGDLVLVTDNTTAGINRAASIFYLYYNGAWRKVGQPLTVDFGSDVIFAPSKSVVIRTAPSSDGAPRRWLNAASY